MSVAISVGAPQRERGRPLTLRNINPNSTLGEQELQFFQTLVEQFAPSGETWKHTDSVAGKQLTLVAVDRHEPYDPYYDPTTEYRLYVIPETNIYVAIIHIQGSADAGGVWMPYNFFYICDLESKLKLSCDARS
jgi:hypothetical protein